MGKRIRQTVGSATSTPLHPAAVAALAVLAAVLGQLAIELGAGRVPVPAELAWLVPIVNAGLVTLVAYLPAASAGGVGLDIQCGGRRRQRVAQRRRA